MVKRYSIPKEECEVGFFEFYSNAAKRADIPVSYKTIFDCRKICVTKPVGYALREYYRRQGYTNIDIGMATVKYGPKANLSGDGYEFELEDGFAMEME